MYNGRQYRSRLEARWQAMFDLLNWQAEYEPFEVNGWNPDFSISSTAYNTNGIIVEIKPSFLITKEMLSETHEKYKSCGCHILILDENPFRPSTRDFGLVVFGVGLEHHIDINPFEMGDEIMIKEPPFDISSHTFSWTGWVHGKEENRKRFLYYDFVNDHRHISNLKTMWATAANNVMFQVKNKDNG